MDDLIRIDLTGERQVGLRFEQFPDWLHADLRAEIDALTIELFAAVSAAMHFKHETGKLRSELQARVFEHDDRIVGVVDIKAPDVSEIRKAGALEYGSRGTMIDVSGYVRGEDHRSLLQRLFNAPMDGIVKAYPRTPNIAEMAFERGPLAEMEPQIVTRLTAAVERAVAKVNG